MDMNTLLNPYIFEVIDNMRYLVVAYSHDFMEFSLALAGLLVFIVVVQESYKLMLLQKGFDLMFWVRPFVMITIIATWNGLPYEGKYQSFPGIIGAIFSPFSNASKGMFLDRTRTLNQLKEKKNDLLRQKWALLIEKGAEVSASKEALSNVHKEENDSGSGIFSDIKESISNTFDSIKNSIATWTKMIVLQISTWLDKVLEWVGNFVWAIAVYATFTTQSLALGFLTLFGPIAFGLSVFDLWRDAWASWLMKFISFHFYSFVAYVIMTACCSLIEFGVKSDIKLLSEAGFPEAFSFNALYTLFGYFVGAMAMKMVPEIVSWIVPTNASSAAAQFSQGLSSGALAPAQMATSALVGGIASRTVGKWGNQGMDKVFGGQYNPNSASQKSSTPPKGSSTGSGASSSPTPKATPPSSSSKK